MKIIKIVILLVIFLFVINISNAQTYCNKAVVGTYDITCNFEVSMGVSDGFCPENYGDWSSCTQNAFGQKCKPPDKDCPNSGNLDYTIPDVKSGTNLMLDGKALGIVNPGIGILDLIDASTQTVGSTPNCPSPTCTVTNNIITPIIAPAGGGIAYYYTVKFGDGRFTGGVMDTRSVIGSGATFPRVNILNFKKIVGQNEIGPDFTESEPLKDNIGFPIDTASAIGVNKIELFIYRENAPNNYEKIAPAGPNACVPDPNANNKIGEITFTPEIISPSGIPDNIQDYTFTWDSKVCDNKKFKIVAKAYHTRPYGQASGDAELIFKLQNPQPPIISEPTRILKLVFVKVKTWILT